MEKFKAFFNKTFWQTLAVSIICYIVFEKFNFVSNAIVDYFISINTSFSNNYYASLAKNNSFEIDIQNSFAVLMLLAMFVGFKGGKYMRKTNEAKSEIQFILEETKKNRKAPNEKEKKAVGNNGELDAEALNLKRSDDLALYRAYYKKIKSGTYLFTGMTCILVLFITINYSINKSKNIAQISFKQKTTILLPYIGQDEVNKFNSSWALMKNAADYDKIITQIEEAKKKYLPQ